MMSAFSVLFAIVLFSELNGHTVTVAVLSTNAEDVVTDQDGLDSVLGDETMAEPVLVPTMYRRSVTLDNNMKEDRSPKVIIISDTRLRGHGVRGLNPAFPRSYPLISERSLSHAPEEFTLNTEKKDKDLDMLRCMIGRVYRPCWEA
ncbi:pro-MCH [Kryptolebias marmoratus]|uniref:pro-MCH n=1 Tax=Kryptolebias marmoratus TaxID=37003 RepID=UPI0007F8F9D2|nr:pro-MCH [Kryptolebias marmoratus]